MSHTWNDHQQLVGEARRLDGLIEDHRERAHRTASIPEKVELITTMINLRRARTRLVGSRTASISDALSHC